mgnify:CR=1 FL=1
MKEQVNKKTLRILVVTNLYPTPKTSNRIFVKEQIESLREHYPDLAIDIHVIEGYSPKGAYLRDMLRLPAIVKNGRYNIVHAHFGLALISTMFVHAPIVVTFHGSDLLVNPTKHISKILAHRASKVIVVAQRLRDCLGYGEVIPCGIRVKDFALPLSHMNTPRLSIPGKLRVLFPANPIAKVKNYDLFQAVCEELERKGNRVERIHLMNIDRTKVPEVYWNCDLMLLTSSSEGSPTVIKEAIAAKLPFVSVDVGDVKEWSRLVEFGVVVPGREPKTIADMAISLLSRVKHRPLLDNSKCLEMMDIENIAKRIRRVYEDLLDVRSK